MKTILQRPSHHNPSQRASSILKTNGSQSASGIKGKNALTGMIRLTQTQKKKKNSHEFKVLTRERIKIK